MIRTMKLFTILLLILSGLLCVASDVIEHQSNTYQGPTSIANFIGEMCFGMCVVVGLGYLWFEVLGVRPGPNY
jgi:hypothetical protein